MLAGCGAVFARRVGQTVGGFGARLLPKGLAAAAEPPLLCLLALGKPQERPFDWDFSALALAGRDPHHLNGCLMVKLGPHLLPLSGGTTSRLLTAASVAAAIARTLYRTHESQGKTKTLPTLHLLSLPRAAITPGRLRACVICPLKLPE